MKIKSLKLAAALSLAAAGAHAQDAGALVDALVRKGILTDQEAEAVRADMTKDFASTSAGKINLSNSVSELKLYGDLRLRYQYDNKDAQLNPPTVGVNNPVEDRSPSGSQRSRWRFRLRLNADVRLAENFYGGVELQTSLNADSGNQTFQDGFNKYPIFISRAFMGWNPTDWFNVVAGKFANPFYSTDMVWDPDISPQGISETVAFHKMYFGGSEGGLSKDGKSVAPAIKEDRPWELSLVAGQFIFDDNLESNFDNDSATDAYLFETQLIGSYKFGNGVKLTVAPAWMIYVNGALAGLDNENSFNDGPGISGGTRNLNIIDVPGDVSFKLGGMKAKVYWDFAYNIEARKRVENIYNMVSLRTGGKEADPNDFDSRHNVQDDFAYLIGLQLGENKKKGDWSMLANWRQVGLGALDPNLTDSDFALGELNVRGFKVSTSYSFTDFLVGTVSYFYAWNLRDDLTGGQATGGNAIGDSNVVQVLQVDVSMKF